MKYTQQETDFLLSVSWMCRKQVTALFNEKFNRSQTHENIKRYYKRRKLKRDFSKSPRMPNSGSFKKGQKAHNEMKIGDEYTHPVCGLVMVKTEQGRVFKHHLNWGEEIPKGCFITFKDGDKQNCNKDNLVMVTGAEFLNFNRLYSRKANSENRESLLLMAKLKTEVYSKKAL